MNALNAARLPANRNGDRCGHNFPILQCPYHGCVSRELYEALNRAVHIMRWSVGELVPGIPTVHEARERIVAADAALAKARAAP